MRGPIAFGWTIRLLVIRRRKVRRWFRPQVFGATYEVHAEWDANGTNLRKPAALLSQHVDT
jgi:hypothetical protein